MINQLKHKKFVLMMIFLILGFSLTGLLVTFANHGPANSHLVEVGPINPDFGYPMWYKDANGMMLELCLDLTYCAFVPGDIPDETSPISMPDNFPGEAFYWLGEALMLDATPNGGSAIITMALEAAFANDQVIDGDQIVFGRVRIRVDNLVEGGTYTVTHPYGVNVFENIGPDAGPGTAKGPGISFVEDIGIGALGDFTGALNSRIGPFLTWEAGAVVPPGYIGDGGLTEHRVVGSPFGTNFYRIEGPDVGAAGSPFLCADPTLGPDPVATTDCIETDLFVLLGKLATNFGVQADQITYTRDGSGIGSLDVFAHSVAGEVIEVNGSGIGTLTLDGDSNGDYFGRINFSGLPPASVSLSNVTDTPATVITDNVVDAVTILAADYNPVTQELMVTAVSSDLWSPPTLTAVGLGPLALTGSGGWQAIFTGISVPPQTVTVVSSAGGADTELVSVIYVNSNPVAVDDVAFLNIALAQSVDIDILANDTDADGTIDPATVVITNQPANGTLSVDTLTGITTYTPNVGFLGVDTFTYTVNDNAGLTSNEATVTITVDQVANNPPVANDDTAVTDEDTAV
ncbi:MAG: cadherin-like domain-containing protein, partial [Anaerolineae bacterium]